MTAFVVAVGLLVANAFFVAVEFALVASRVARLENLADSGDRRARLALAAARDIQPQLAGAQLGITMASLGLGYVAEPAVAHLLEGVVDAVTVLPEGSRHPLAFAVALAIVVTAHMVLGEMVPKNVAIAGPERVARLLVPAHRVFVRALRPLIAFLNGTAAAIVRLLGLEPVDEIGTTLTVREFRTLLAGARAEGVIEPTEHELLAGALDFRARTAASIMVPRHAMVTVSRSTPVAEVEALMARTGHTRLPVTGAGPDDVVGFVHVKDLLRLPADAHDDPVPLEAIRRLLVVAPDLSLRDVLRLMRRQRRHIALVRDASGRPLGMVTLEDVLEALVGDITDETDRAGDAGA
ncbi:MAG: HlyC/CorC family transporter [Actinomyces sp.]|nr:MAG: HlyC/CorC family transporter [Actinomyces sp.]